MKSEKEKMLDGELYICGDGELAQMWHEAQRLTREYMQCDTRDAVKRDQILTELFGGRGKRLSVSAPLFVDYGRNIFLGDNCEINFNCTFLDCGKITIGDNALIAPNVQIYTVNHPLDISQRFSRNSGDGFNFAYGYTQDVTIGNNVWIGGGVIILPGVEIGDNVTIAAGSVVTKSIPSNSLAVGNPCRVIRSLP